MQPTSRPGLTSSLTDWPGELRDFQWHPQVRQARQNCSPGLRRRLMGRNLRSDWPHWPPASRPAPRLPMHWRLLSMRWRHSRTRHAPALHFSWHRARWFPLPRDSRSDSAPELARRCSGSASETRCQTSLCPRFRQRIQREKSATARGYTRAGGVVPDRFAQAALETAVLAGTLDVTGIVILHTVPWPTSESIAIFPPFSSIARIANGRPKPLPPLLVVK